MPQPSRSYSTKLLDPRWQRKRLKILERDQWACQECGATENSLHVHHLYYRSGLEPWEYPDGSLTTLCADCHRDGGDGGESAEMVLIDALRRKGFNNPGLMSLSLEIAEMSLEDAADLMGTLCG